MRFTIQNVPAGPHAELYLESGGSGEVHVKANFTGPEYPGGSKGWYLGSFTTTGTFRPAPSLPSNVGLSLDANGCIAISH